SGGVCAREEDFLVAGRTTPVPVAAVLLVERGSVEVGGVVRVLALAGLPEQPWVLERLRSGEVVSRETLLGDRRSMFEIPVREEDRGGFALRLSLVTDHQPVIETVSVLVPWTDRQLSVSFATFRDRIRPGTPETWRVTVKSPPGTRSEERTAQLLAYMYDRSLDAFGGYYPPNPLSLYPNHAIGGYLRSSVSTAGAAWVFENGFGPRAAPPLLHGDRPKFLEGYGVGGPGVRTLRADRLMAKAQAVTANAAADAERGVMGGVVGAPAPASEPPPERGPVVTGEAPPPPALRSDFSETGFWKPRLLTDADGSAVIEFQVPDSVTSWNVWVHAITRDLKAGSVHRETRSVKDLMVRPYVPRFLRESDRGELEVVVNNASDRPMSGTVALDILDAETNHSALAEFGLTPATASQAFTAAAGGGANATFSLDAPKRVGTFAIKATAVAGDFSDGELRPVPVLPGRMQLSQSRFAALSGGEARTLAFEDMAKSDDPSRVDEQLVVTIDAQLFHSVLAALPYLVNYPYECTEQTLNRFVSTGIVASLFRNYPAVGRMAQDFAKRETPLDAWAAPDPTRQMALEETPWLETARGGKDAGSGLVRILDPRAATAEREASLAKLRRAQTASGAFPWWPGGPPSPYMTLYAMYGFAKAAESGVEVPKDIVQRGWGYLARHFREEYEKRMAQDRCSPEWLTFLGYVATGYPDPSWMGDALTPAERREILAFSFKHWRAQSPYLKGMLALTLSRSSRPKDAALVWGSVMDSAKTDRDLGTYWAPEDRAWLWYEDTIETQAFALRTLMELSPSDERRHGLVQWLFLNKKLNQWKSTRATAEVLYALVSYLKKEGALAARESVTVSLAGQRTTFDFEPDRYTGKRDQLVVPGERIDPRRDAAIAVSKTGTGLAFASATWTFSTDRLPAEERGDLFAVSRRYYRREATPSGFELRPLAEGATLSPGDEVEVELSIRAKHAAEYVHLRDPRAAGLEPGVATSGYRWDLGLARYEEIRDSGTNFFFEWLPAGEYTLKYRVRANMAGTFRVGPATLQSMYAPEFSAYSAGAVITVK
ncbi:MAG: alpha-2-macroglobulin family protein, partial [Syntrophomonadaceae bacterium]